MSSRSPIYHSLSLSPPPVMQLMTECSGWSEREMGLFGNIPHHWGSLTLTHTLLHSPWERSQVKKVSLGTELCHLGGGMMQVKSDCSSSPLLCIQPCIYLLQWYAGTSLLETWTSTKALLSVGDCPRQCSPGAPGLGSEGLESVHGPLEGP